MPRIYKAQFCAPRFDKFEDAFKDPIECPSLHLMGTEDPHAELSRRLTPAFADPVVIEHPGGHAFPQLDQRDQEKVTDFLTKAMAAPKL